MILELSAAADSHVWVGLVGKNFNPDGDHWNQEFFDIKNQKKTLVTACRSSDGIMYRNGAEQSSAKGRPFGSADVPRIQLEINGGTKELEVNMIDKSSDLVANVQLDDMKPEVCVAVCFSPTPEGAASTVRVVGSSCEAAEKASRRSSKDLWDEDNEVGVNDKKKGAVGDAELFGQ